MKFPKRLAVTAGAAGSALAARLGLPYLMTYAANLSLNKIPGYRAHVDTVKLSLSKGRIGVQGVLVSQKLDGRELPLADIGSILVDIHWRDLMRGGLVADISVQRPIIYIDLALLKQQRADQAQAKSGTNASGETSPVSWQQKLRNFMPFQVNVLVAEGEFHIKGLPRQNGTSIRVEAFDLAVENLTNSAKLAGSLMALVEARARVLSRGQLDLHAQVYPIADKPLFNADIKVENVDLAQLRPMIQETAGIDVKAGVAEIYAEAAAKDGKLRGYVKPVIEKADIEPLLGHDVTTALKGKAARMVTKLLESRKEDRIATRIDFHGSLDNPDVDTLGAIGLLLRNAFVKTFSPDLERRVYLEHAGAEPEKVKVAYHKPGSSKFRRTMGLIKETMQKWVADEAPRMSAALAYYTAFSIAPLLLLVIAIAGFAFGREAAQGQIFDQLVGLVGAKSAAAIQSMLRAADQPAKGAWATVISVVTLLLGATGVLSELKNGLNKIWRTNDPSGLKSLVKQNVKYFGIILAIGFLLLVSLAFSAGLAAIGKSMGGALPLPEPVLHLLNLVISWVIITALFAVLYKVLPNTQIGWRDVWIGAAVTSFLFSIGKMLLGLYLGKGTVGSAYGSAGAIMIALLWVYYSGLILYLGAEFTKVWADRYGSRRNISFPPQALKKAA